ncbi:MAG: hypothetical protein V4553_18775 [Bacteroidota bacterium]|jgi:hypothetical protein
MIKIIIPLFALVLIIAFTANAQRLPDVQKESLRAPAGINVDGKATEWDNKLHAFNKSTEIFYTVSNDDNRLYLTVLATRRNIIDKIINGGIAFTIKKGGKKDPEGATISYPVYKGNDRPNIDYRAFDDINPKSINAVKQADGIIALANLGIMAFSNLIKVDGIKGVDTLITVDNTRGINAASAVDNKMAYTVELAIDLKLLSLSTTDQSKFSYNITLTAVGQADMPEIEVEDPTEGLTKGKPLDKAKKADQYSSSRFSTDFWGEYTLVKQ